MSSPPQAPRRLAPGSRVLITGFTGLIGSAQAEYLLELGLKVRGTTRSAAKGQALVEKLNGKYGADAAEVVEVTDAASADAYTAAFEGISGFVHCAAEMNVFQTANPDAATFIKSSIELTLAVLKAAHAQPSVKAGVLTSSLAAAHFQEAGVTSDLRDIGTSWNTKYRAKAFSASSDDPGKALYVYCAIKMESEQAAWKYVKEQKVGYSFNTVLPDLTIGGIVNPAPGYYSTASLTQGYYLQNAALAPTFLAVTTVPSLYVSLADVARIQAAALLEPDVDGERLWAAADTYTLAEIHRVLEKVSGGTKTFEDVEVPPKPTVLLDGARSVELLGRYGREGWDSLEDAIRAALADVDERAAAAA